MRTSGLPLHSCPGAQDCGDSSVCDSAVKMTNWSSDPASLPGSNNKRHISAAALMPFSSGRRTLPSKWDDAERWITSPASSHGGYRKPLDHTQRKAKSKSGPVGQTGLVYFPYFLAPALATSGRVLKNSPLAAGVLLPDPSLGLHFGAGNATNVVSKSGDLPGLLSYLDTGSPESDPLNGKLVEEEIPQQEKQVATQMCPHSPSKDQVLTSIQHSSPAPTMEATVSEVIRDVQINKDAENTSKQSDRRGLKKKIMVTNKKEHLPSKWNSSEVSQKLSKLQREEAKISAWESLQKAKAETAMRKLEMQLEKKRSASMDRISFKLRQAQTKAEAKRNMLSMEDPAMSWRGCKHFAICFSGSASATRGSP